MLLREKIENLCKQKGISVRKLEMEIGVGNGVIRKWDGASPRIDNVKAAADYFGVTVDELLRDDTAQAG